MKLKQLMLIYKVLDDYADIVFDNQHEHSEETIVETTEALRIVKIELEKIKEDLKDGEKI
tara:strand:- start:621 stop:800 length:180 start_codon:yes stop_codon:yes gene_type:complete